MDHLFCIDLCHTCATMVGLFSLLLASKLTRQTHLFHLSRPPRLTCQESFTGKTIPHAIAWNLPGAHVNYHMIFIHFYNDS